MPKKKDGWSRGDKLGAVGVAVAFIACASAFFIPEVRQFVGVEKPTAAAPPLTPTTQVQTSTPPATALPSLATTATQKPKSPKSHSAQHATGKHDANNAARGSLAVLTPPMTKAPEQAQAAPSLPGVIPEDPLKTAEDARRMRHSLLAVLGKKETITFLMSWPGDDSAYLVTITNVLSEACRETPRQCWFKQQGAARDLDRSPIHGSGRNGITVHGPDADALASALGSWFTTYSTSTFSPELNGYKEPTTEEIIWIEIGPGSPYKPAQK
jgi:hypothetical protein